MTLYELLHLDSVTRCVGVIQIKQDRSIYDLFYETKLQDINISLQDFEKSIGKTIKIDSQLCFNINRTVYEILPLYSDEVLVYGKAKFALSNLKYVLFQRQLELIPKPQFNFELRFECNVI